MKRVVIALALSLSFLAAPAAFAQKSPKAKFYEFPALEIEGGRKAPTASYHTPRMRVKFDRLLKLKKDFMGVLQETGKDAALR